MISCMDFTYKIFLALLCMHIHLHLWLLGTQLNMYLGTNIYIGYKIS